jgi:4-amino-4-deoxy-L-arabinose transferase-like glycosyltransferase
VFSSLGLSLNQQLKPNEFSQGNPKGVLAMRLEACSKRSFDSIKTFLMLFAIAALFYTFRLGSWSLGASDAYSALAASQSSFSEVIEQALRFDPGKPPFYQVLLHCFVGLFGSNETSLRIFSVIFALVALLPLYSLAVSMFGSETALATVAIWAVNPLALILGRWARMYSLFIAAVLMSMLTFWRVREQATMGRVAAFAVCAALVLYTHLCGLLFVGIEAAVLIRDFYRGHRALCSWAGLVIAFALFMPFLSLEALQTRELLFGHWLDWIGIAHFGWSLSKTLMALVAVAVILALAFGPQFETDEREPVRFCALWLIMPIVALSAISIIVRPVFAPRYVAPAAPGLALLVARGLKVFGARVRNLSTTAIATAFAVLFFFCQAGRYEPWLDIARQVAAAGPAQPVFFESPLYARGIRARVKIDEGFDTDFPEGYFRVPFDYYFKGPNPRCVIDPFDPARARHEISDAAVKAGGAWLISGSSDLIARSEMPEPARFRISRVLHTAITTLYHLVALPQ